MATKLVSMKMTAAEQKAQYEPGLAMAKDAPRYPYGLSISLDKATLKKLGVDELPAPGEKYMLMATAEVTNVSSNAGASGDNKSMTLQLVAMCLEDPSDKKDAAKTLYDGDE